MFIGGNNRLRRMLFDHHRIGQVEVGVGGCGRWTATVPMTTPLDWNERLASIGEMVSGAALAGFSSSTSFGGARRCR